MADLMKRPSKAAALVLAMGPEAATDVFRHMSDTEVEALAREVAQLGAVDQKVVNDIIVEFNQEATQNAQLLMGGPRLAERIIRAYRSAVPEMEMKEEVERVLGLDSARPFVWLRDYPPSQVADEIGEEHPQTVALVLAHLPPKLASRILESFDEAQQHRIAMRVATLEPIMPRSIRAVEESLRLRLGPPRASAGGVTGGGAREAATILNQMGRAEADQIMEAMREEDPELATRIREMMFVFEDITNLDDKAIQEVLRSVEPIKLATAMKGVDESVTNVIWRNLSERAGTALREELDLLGPKPRSEIEAARAEVVRSVQRLADEGAIVLSLGGGEDVIA